MHSPQEQSCEHGWTRANRDEKCTVHSRHAHVNHTCTFRPLVDQKGSFAFAAMFPASRKRLDGMGLTDGYGA